MSFLRFSALCFFMFSLCSCVSAPPAPKPLKVSNTDSFTIFRSNVLDQTNHTFQHLNSNKDIAYYQTFGGSVGVGVLFGPLGVAANIKMIESNTMKDVGLLKNKIQIDPAKIFLQAANKAQIQMNSTADTTAIKVNPYLLIEKTDNDVLMFASAMLVETSGTDPRNPLKFIVQLPVTYKAQELANLSADNTEKLNQLVEAGFEKILAQAKEYGNANPATEEKITFVSEFVAPRFKPEMTATIIQQDQEMIWIRLGSGFIGIQRSAIEVKAQKKK